MQHPYLREGIAEERIERMIGDARRAQPGRGRLAVAALLIAVARRLAAEPPSTPTGASALSEAG